MLKISLPFVDLRGKGPVDLLRAYPDCALSLVRSARSSQGLLTKSLGAPAYAMMNRQSHQWLKRNKNPYLYEIETFADIINSKGIYALNLHHEWSCTTGIYRRPEGVDMLRIFDSNIQGMGKSVMLVLQQGRAGTFYNITWPGMAGVFSAMAPKRFAAAINKAPARKYKYGGYHIDCLRNKMEAHKQIALPPSHLLRQVMETAVDYDMAKKMLSHAPIAMPTIYTLAGTKPGEGCTIERTEGHAQIIELGTKNCIGATNHFNTMISKQGYGWHVRTQNSHDRLKSVTLFEGGDLYADNFDWLQAPIINPDTRLSMVGNAATNNMAVQGYEGMVSVTDIFNLTVAENNEQQQTA